MHFFVYVFSLGLFLTGVSFPAYAGEFGSSEPIYEPTYMNVGSYDDWLRAQEQQSVQPTSQQYEPPAIEAVPLPTITSSPQPTTTYPHQTLSVAQYTLPSIGVDFNHRCQGFINKDGTVGSWGSEFLNAMDDYQKTYPHYNKSKCFTGDIDFGSRCPNFKNLSLDQKKHVWLWLWAATAQAESSCNPWVEVRGKYNKTLKRYSMATGLLQMEASEEVRRANGRNPLFCNAEGGNQSIRFQARCAVHLVGVMQCPGKIEESDSYFKKMRSRDSSSTIWRLLRKHPLCS